MAAEPNDPRSIRVTWTGGVCDSRVTVRVDSLDSILVDGGPQPGCDAIGIDRALILTFDQAVDASIVDISYQDSRTGG